MSRNTTIVRNSIISLMDEARKLAELMAIKVTKVDFEHREVSKLLPKKQISQITDTLIRLSTAVGNSANTRVELESLVGRIFDTSVKAWLESNLESIVDEAIGKQK